MMITLLVAKGGHKWEGNVVAVEGIFVVKEMSVSLLCQYSYSDCDTVLLLYDVIFTGIRSMGSLYIMSYNCMQI